MQDPSDLGHLILIHLETPQCRIAGLWQVRSRDAVLLNSYSVGNQLGRIAFDGVNILVANYYDPDPATDGAVFSIRPSDGAVLGTYPVGTRSWGLAFDGAHVWVTSASTSKVSKL